MAAVKNLYIDQGSDFNAQITIYDDNNLPWDLTGYTGEAKIKKSYYSSTSVNFTLSFAASRPTGTVVLELNSSQTSLLEQGRYLYDILIENEYGKKTRVLEGIVTINPGVT
jgi:hypothetical protein